MYNDPIVNEIRKIRERLSKKHNFEVEAIFDDIRKRQTSLGSRLVCQEFSRIHPDFPEIARYFDALS